MNIPGAVGVSSVSMLATLVGQVIDGNTHVSLGTVITVGTIVLTGVIWANRTATNLDDRMKSVEERIKDMPCQRVAGRRKSTVGSEQ